MKFLAFYVLMTILCCIVWEYTAGSLYDIDDPFLPGYLEPGGWAVAWGGHPVVTVARIVHAHPMGQPNAIKEGRSFADLWKLWWGFLTVSLVISAPAAPVQWRTVFARSTGWLHLRT